MCILIAHAHHESQSVNGALTRKATSALQEAGLGVVLALVKFLGPADV